MEYWYKKCEKKEYNISGGVELLKVLYWKKEKHITLEEVKKYALPYADGYRGFWEENISIQHPLAMVELVAWDSGCTIFISKEDELVDKYSEVNGKEFATKIKAFIDRVEVDFEQVKKYLSLFPDKVYRNIYQGGLMNELV